MARIFLFGGRNMESLEERIIRKPELFEKVPLSDTTIWRLEKRGDFPRRMRIGGNAVGWLASEVDEWMRRKAQDR
jgi:prophage regulatory protein